MDGDELLELGADGYLGEKMIAYALHCHLGILSAAFESECGYNVSGTLDEIVLARKHRDYEEFGCND